MRLPARLLDNAIAAITAPMPIAAAPPNEPIDATIAAGVHAAVVAAAVVLAAVVVAVPATDAAVVAAVADIVLLTQGYDFFASLAIFPGYTVSFDGEIILPAANHNVMDAVIDFVTTHLAVISHHSSSLSSIASTAFIRLSAISS